MTVVTRFAPSPTGFLHIGGARTALFNWLYARHHGGTFRLRIEDTDRKRSTDEAIAAILDGLKWLDLEWDDEVVYQFSRADAHRAAADRLLADGKAYRCYCTPEELQEMRDAAKAEGKRMLYDGRWRDRDPAEAPEGIDPVIRFKAPQDGETTLGDAVQGDVTVPNDQLDDMVLLRSDGTPTYMLSVVVDDHDMGVTHAIRGDDHLTNAFRQTQLFMALGWEPPTFAHIPLIHGPDGAKLSKRHGALGIEAYRDMGYLPEAVCSYLLRLGWSHGDEENITREQAVEWFDIGNVNKGAARIDFDKLESVNAHFLKSLPAERILADLVPGLAAATGADPDDTQISRLEAALPELTPRAKTLPELIENAKFIAARRPLEIQPKAAKSLDDDGKRALADLAPDLDALSEWSADAVQTAIRAFAERHDLKLGKVAQPLRAALTGSTVSPGIFEVAEILGKEETLGRLKDAIGGV